MVNKLYFHRKYILSDAHGGRHGFGTKIRATEETIDEIVSARGGFEAKTLLDPLPSSRLPDDLCISELIETEGFTRATLHIACFVGLLALKAGVASIEQVFVDCGLIHEIAHKIDLGSGDEVGNPWATTEDIKLMARGIERAIPGHPNGQPTPPSRP